MKQLINKPKKKETDLTLLFAHGAGAPMDSEFMETIASHIAGQGVTVVRFEFPYMAERRESGKKRPPDRMPKLMDCFELVVEEWGGPAKCVGSGKSMGGRVASMMLAEQNVAGAVSLGYPFHPPGKPEKVRKDHWQTMADPWLIVQGTRDTFGKPNEVAEYGLPQCAHIEWLEDGDHDFKPRKSSGLEQKDHWLQAAIWTAEFVKALGDK